MISIYKIEDINDLTYVGSTSTTLNMRLSQHRCHKRRGQYVSSSKLNLDNCIITLLEECSKEERKQREKYWINHLDTVNDRKLDYDDKQYHEYMKQYHQKNKEKINSRKREYDKQYRKKNKDKKKQWYQQNKEKILSKQRAGRLLIRQQRRLLPESRDHVPAP